MTRAPLPWPKGEIVVATRATLLAALAVASGACGGAPTGGAASAGQPSGDAARCLAAAGAKHARKPSEPYRIGAKHILVRYGGARGAPATVTRTREQACLRAEEALASLKAGTAFTDAVGKFSDDAGGVSHDGSVGSVQRGDVAPPFADAAFELEPGEVSQVIETPFGFHVILRVE